MLIVDANDLDKVKSMLDDATDFMCERHERGRLFFEKVCLYSPHSECWVLLSAL